MWVVGKIKQFQLEKIKSNLKIIIFHQMKILLRKKINLLVKKTIKIKTQLIKT